MPLSRVRDRKRKRRERVKAKLLGSLGGLRKKLWDMKLTLDAKQARIFWQSSGICGLHEKIATLEARLATLPAMQDTEVLKRLAAVEADQALHEAEHNAQVPEEEEKSGEPQTFFQYLHPRGEGR